MRSHPRRQRPLLVAACILLGVLLVPVDARRRHRGHAPPSAPIEELPPDLVLPNIVNVDYPFPYIKGHPIDSCLTVAGAAGDCGKAAAEFFCHFQGCEEAVAYAESAGERGPTWVAGDGVVRNNGGGSFDKITCQCSVPESSPGAADANQIVYENPQILAHPVDFCLKKGKVDCGQPAAAAFCQSFGNSNSTSFVEDPKPKVPTWLIGDHALSEAVDRKSFQRITCV